MARPQAPGGVSFVDSKGSDSIVSSEDMDQNSQRTKFLTMKYGQSQIKLIQKRLKVEFWMDAELKRLYEVNAHSGETYPCDVDLDDIIDLETKEEKRQHLLKMFSHCKQPIEDFVEEVLTRLETL